MLDSVELEQQLATDRESSLRRTNLIQDKECARNAHAFT